MIVGIAGDKTYVGKDLKDYLTETYVRGGRWSAEICYVSNLKKRSIKFLKVAVKESASRESLHGWMKDGRSRTGSSSMGRLLTTVGGATIMLGMMVALFAVPIIAGEHDPALGVLTAPIALCGAMLVLPILCCIFEARDELLGLRLWLFCRRHQSMRLTPLVNELVYTVAGQLQQLETPLPEEEADDPDRARLKLACTIRADELEGFVLKNRALIEALGAARSEGTKVPKLERREASRRLRNGASRIAIQIDTCQRMALEAAQYHQDEKQRQKERERLHKQSLRRLKEGAVLTQVHTALGWTSQDAAVMCAFDALEAEQAKERAAQAGLLTRGRQLVKQLPSPRKGKKPPRKGKKSKRKGQKEKP